MNDRPCECERCWGRVAERITASRRYTLEQAYLDGDDIPLAGVARRG